MLGRLSNDEALEMLLPWRGGGFAGEVEEEVGERPG
jgi:hypothetical protein